MVLCVLSLYLFASTGMKHCYISCEFCRLAIPRRVPLIGKLIAVNRRRTYNTMAKKGDKSTNKNLQNITQTTKV